MVYCQYGKTRQIYYKYLTNICSQKIRQIHDKYMTNISVGLNWPHADGLLSIRENETHCVPEHSVAPCTETCHTTCLHKYPPLNNARPECIVCGNICYVTPRSPLSCCQKKRNLMKTSVQCWEIWWKPHLLHLGLAKAQSLQHFEEQSE